MVQVQPLRKFEERAEHGLVVIPTKKVAREVRLPLTIKMFLSSAALAIGFVFMQATEAVDPTTRAVIGLLVSLVGTLAFLVYRDVVRRTKSNEDAIRDVEHKIDKAIRAFTGILVATHPEKAAEIYDVSEAFFRKEN